MGAQDQCSTSLWLACGFAIIALASTAIAQSPAGPIEYPLAAPHSGDLFNGAYATPWTWQLLPNDLLYRSYLAAPGEARMSSAWLNQTGQGWIWDFTIGARVGLLRFGSAPGTAPEGWQLDLQGAALPRLNIEQDYDLESVDFVGGLPL
ncbi:MAG: hypothetical protein U0992_24000, partial [Planctomycetaceae bacterium]